MFQVHSVLSKSISFLLHILWSIDCSSYVNVWFMVQPYVGRIFYIDNLGFNVYDTWYQAPVWYPIILCSEIFLLNQTGWRIKLHFQRVFHWGRTSFVRTSIYANNFFSHVSQAIKFLLFWYNYEYTTIWQLVHHFVLTLTYLNYCEVDGWWTLSGSLTVFTSLQPSSHSSVRLPVYVFPFFLYESAFPYLSLAWVFTLD